MMVAQEMFCFQCEQTAGCRACTGRAGACGKTAGAAQLQDQLTGALLGMAQAAAGRETSAAEQQLLLEGLYATLTNVSFDEARLRALLTRAQRAAGAAYDMSQVWTADEDIRSLKSLLLFGLRGMAAYAYHARLLGYTDAAVDGFFWDGLRAVGADLGLAELLAHVRKLGEINLQCMALLDRAHCAAYGAPAPATVPLRMEKGPFIVVSGHDLHDLHLLLEQTAGKGVNIYTHGEMLPAHAYPRLKAYPQLKGNFGTAWQNQRREFAGLPAPVLFTSNCLMPPGADYADRVFTTGVVSFAGVNHIGAEKDFTPLIKKALELGGFAEDKLFAGMNGGTRLTTGFGHDAMLGIAGQIIDAVKSGAIRRLFLVAGCDGARPERSYYTEFVKLTPPDTVVLTLACGKYRFHDLDLGTINGLPRLLDMGQCNDAYSAIRVAAALAEALGCGLDALPLSMVLSWYEQKAVCILLTLLHLGMKNILLGPSLPAFVSPNVLALLVEQYQIAPISTPQADLARLLR